MVAALALVDFAMASQVGHNREMTATALDFTSEWLLASVAVHMGLKGAWACETLITDFTLVFLL
jgi:hypothetical protein